MKTTIGLLLALCLAWIAPAQATASAASEETTDSAAEDQDGGVPPAVARLKIINARSPEPNLLTGGQLNQEQMTALREQGYSSFISLRPEDEDGAGWEEGFAKTSGIIFHRLAVAGASGVTVENAEHLSQLLSQSSKPTVIYCASGNRVGALLALKAHFIDGLPADEALRFGTAAGLTRLEPHVRDLLDGN